MTVNYIADIMRELLDNVVQLQNICYQEVQWLV